MMYRVCVFWKEEFNEDNIKVFSGISEVTLHESGKMLIMLSDCGESVGLNLDCVRMYTIKRVGDGEFKSK